MARAKSPPLYPESAGTVKFLRKKLGMSQEEFAETLGVSRLQVNRLENGRLTASAEMAVILEEKTGYSARQIVYASARDLLSAAQSRHRSLYSAALKRARD